MTGGPVLGVLSAVAVQALRNRSEKKGREASPYEALASRVVTLEASDTAKHNQIVTLSTKVMTIEATSETRRVLLTKAASKHAGVVAHVDVVEEWIEEQTPGACPPRLDPELRSPVATA